MYGVTLGLGIVGLAAVMMLRPTRGLMVYLGVLCWYAAWQPAPVLGINLTAPRIIILGLLMRCVVDGRLTKRFRWAWLDTLVVVFAAAEIVSGLMTSPTEVLLQNRAGALFDTGLVYFVGRLAIVSRQDYAFVLKGLLVIAAPIAVLGVIQSVTGSNPWGNLVRAGEMEGGAIQAVEGQTVRWGLWRARANFFSPIVFGFFFACVGACGAGLWKTVTAGKRWKIGAGLAGTMVGLGSSLSSGPLLAAAISAPVIAVYRYRRYWKAGLAVLGAGLLAAEIGSNRHWYEVAASFCSFNPATAYYRIELVEETFSGGMEGHWLMGYGLRAGGQVAVAGISHWKHQDITNHYVYELMRFGLLGLVPLLAVFVGAFSRVRRAYRSAASESDRWVVWCLGAMLAGAAASMMSACWEGQAYSLFFLFLGATGSMPGIVRASVEKGETAAAAAKGGVP
ncbi:MAG: hypothetical protein V2A58_10835 [Planctomycetota bacterium]